MKHNLYIVLQTNFSFTRIKAVLIIHFYSIGGKTAKIDVLTTSLVLENNTWKFMLLLLNKVPFKSLHIDSNKNGRKQSQILYCSDSKDSVLHGCWKDFKHNLL